MRVQVSKFRDYSTTKGVKIAFEDILRKMYSPLPISSELNIKVIEKYCINIDTEYNGNGIVYDTTLHLYKVNGIVGIVNKPSTFWLVLNVFDPNTSIEAKISKELNEYLTTAKSNKKVLLKLLNSYSYHTN